MPQDRRGAPAALADDRSAVPKGMGRASRGRRPQGRGLLEGPPGSLDGSQEERRAIAASRELDARAEARGTVRPEWQAYCRTEGTRARRSAPDERQSARQQIGRA